MKISMLQSKIHRATVTEADLSYEGSISIDPELIKAAGFLPNQKVDVLNCNNGERFSTYVIKGRPGEVCLNGAAARLVQRGDIVIIVAYCELDLQDAKLHVPTVVFVNSHNQLQEVRAEREH